MPTATPIPDDEKPLDLSAGNKLTGDDADKELASLPCQQSSAHVPGMDTGCGASTSSGAARAVNLGPPAEHATMPGSVSSGRCPGLAPYAEPLLNCPSGGHGESVMKLGGRRLSIVPTAQHSTRSHAHPGQGKLSLGVSEPVDDENYTSEVDVGLARPAAVSSSAEEDTTCLRALHSTRIAPFMVG